MFGGDSAPRQRCFGRPVVSPMLVVVASVVVVDSTVEVGSVVLVVDSIVVDSLAVVVDAFSPPG